MGLRPVPCGAGVTIDAPEAFSARMVPRTPRDRGSALRRYRRVRVSANPVRYDLTAGDAAILAGIPRPEADDVDDLNGSKE
jgi:hypothetical protein